jgi:hypothetical protein
MIKGDDLVARKPCEKAAQLGVDYWAHGLCPQSCNSLRACFLVADGMRLDGNTNSVRTDGHGRATLFILESADGVMLCDVSSSVAGGKECARKSGPTTGTGDGIGSSHRSDQL